MDPSETREAGWEKAGFLGFVCALVTLVLLTMFWAVIVMTDMPRWLMHSRDIDGRVVSLAFMVGIFVPIICFVRSLIWIFRTFPLPSMLVWRRFVGGCLGGFAGILGAYASGAAAGAWFGLGPLTFVAVGLALPPLLCCFGEAVATRRTMRRNCGSVTVS